MTPQSVLAELLERFGALEGQTLYVNNEELCAWPAEAVVALKTAGMLVKAHPTSSIVCTGCQRQCSRDVEVFPEEYGRPARAMFVCDEPEDMGIISVDLSSLERWQLSGAAFADALSRMVGVTNPVPPDNAGKSFVLGVLRGQVRSASVTLSIINDISLSVAGHTVPVAEIMRFNGKDFGVDRVRLLELVDKPPENESPEDRAERLRESIREEKAGGNRTFLKTVAKREGISDSRLKQILSRRPAGTMPPSNSGVSKARRDTSMGKKPTK